MLCETKTIVCHPWLSYAARLYSISTHNASFNNPISILVILSFFCESIVFFFLSHHPQPSLIRHSWISMWMTLQVTGGTPSLRKIIPPLPWTRSHPRLIHSWLDHHSNTLQPRRRCSTRKWVPKVQQGGLLTLAVTQPPLLLPILQFSLKL